MLADTRYAISELARRFGVPVPTLRYYDELGLLPRPGGAAASATTATRTCAGSP